MAKGKETDNSSAADSESLGETTDVLNMVMVFLFIYIDMFGFQFLMYSYMCTSCAVTCIKKRFWCHYVCYFYILYVYYFIEV